MRELFLQDGNSLMTLPSGSLINDITERKPHRWCLEPGQTRPARVAVLFAGQWRTHKFVQPSWYEHIFSQFQTDVFMHTWDRLGTRLDMLPESIYYDLSIQDSELAMEDDVLLKFLWKWEEHQYKGWEEFGGEPKIEELEKAIEKNYGYASVKIDDYKEFGYKFLYDSAPMRKKKEPKRRIVNQFSQWYSVAQAYKLMRQHQEKYKVEYDFVIRARPDLLLRDFTIFWDDKVKTKAVESVVKFLPLSWLGDNPTHCQKGITGQELLKKGLWLLVWKGSELHDWFAMTSNLKWLHDYCMLYYNLPNLYEWAEYWYEKDKETPKYFKGQHIHRFYNPHLLLWSQLWEQSIPYIHANEWLKMDIKRSFDYED